MYHIKDNSGSYTVVINNGQPHKFDASHPSYAGLVECLHAGDADEFVNLINSASVIEDWSEGSFECKDGFLYFEDEQVASQPTHRVIELIKGGYDPKPILNFLSLLYDNVSERAVQESYKWSSHKGLPITEDGMMIGYKGVRYYVGEDTVDKMGNTLTEGDLVDIYTGNSFRNNVGDKCGMKRRQVCDDHTVGCSKGLHVGTFDYASNWAGNTGVVVLVKFNPSDIVSVPSDCEFSKMRVSDYEVISIAREQLEEPVYDDGEEFDDYDLAIDELDDDMPF
tara:strand:- start:158 stop:997 length:840 start_codon:yes stop_codon:yes gene_type:complete